jgi:hypothetical protein
LALEDDPNLFIADTGASAHSTGTPIGLYELRSAGDETGMMAMLCSKYGTTFFPLILDDGHYVPGQKFNLFSLTKAIEKDWTLGGSKNGVWIIRKDD